MNLSLDQDTPSRLAQLIEQARREGPRQYARWDGALFDKLALDYIPYFEERIRSQDNYDAVLTATTHLIKEAIGRGYVKADELYLLDQQNLLAYMLFSLLLFRTAGKIDAEEQLPLMAKAWNLCEHLLQSPPWMQQLLHARRNRCNSLKELPGFMAETLAPVMEPQATTSWQGPFEVEILDTFDINNAFLPGRMHFVAPSVLCVHDARRDECIGVILKHSPKHREEGTKQDATDPDEAQDSPLYGASEFIGETGCMGPSSEASDEASENQPELRWDKDTVTLNGQSIALTRMGHRARHAISHAGFVVVSTHNSQRLWVMKTP